MLHSVSTTHGCSPSLVFALCLPLILLLNDGYSEASMYHIKGKTYSSFPAEILQKNNLLVRPSPFPALLFSIRKAEINTCIMTYLQPLSQTQLADRRLCPLSPDLAFRPRGALCSRSVCSYWSPSQGDWHTPEDSSRSLQEWEDNSLWMLDLDINVPDLLQQGFCILPRGQTFIESAKFWCYFL